MPLAPGEVHGGRGNDVPLRGGLARAEQGRGLAALGEKTLERFGARELPAVPRHELRGGRPLGPALALAPLLHHPRERLLKVHDLSLGRAELALNVRLLSRQLRVGARACPGTPGGRRLLRRCQFGGGEVLQLQDIVKDRRGHRGRGTCRRLSPGLEHVQLLARERDQLARATRPRLELQGRGGPLGHQPPQALLLLRNLLVQRGHHCRVRLVPLGARGGRADSLDRPDRGNDRLARGGHHIEGLRLKKACQPDHHVGKRARDPALVRGQAHGEHVHEIGLIPGVDRGGNAALNGVFKGLALQEHLLVTQHRAVTRLVLDPLGGILHLLAPLLPHPHPVRPVSPERCRFHRGDGRAQELGL
mmetsp:Transcript_4570/g.15008  ORF Transcript_4570/g.15008 Transcript_4570/m.15008 type:complete len:361 (-) Transcript_4570:407-1489(-)